MIETTPRVSAFMPAYNAARWLKRAIDSLRTQTYRDIEIILVDDGSDDDTAAIMQAAARDDERIRSATIKHAGPAAAANHAVGMARGEYIARLDADDIALPDRLARQVAWLDDHPDIAALGGAIVVIDADERKLSTARFALAPDDIRRVALERSPIAHPTIMMRRSVFLDVGGYRSAFDTAADYDLWLRISERTDLANLAEVLVYYRRHPGQISVRFNRRQSGMAALAAAIAAMRRRGEPDPIPEGFVATADSIRALGLDADVQSPIGERLGSRAIP